MFDKLTPLRRLNYMDKDFKVYKVSEHKNSHFVLHVQPKSFLIKYSALSSNRYGWSPPKTYNVWIPEQIYIVKVTGRNNAVLPISLLYRSGNNWVAPYIPNINLSTVEYITEYVSPDVLMPVAFCGLKHNPDKINSLSKEGQIQTNIIYQFMNFYSSSFNADYIPPIWSGAPDIKSKIKFKDYFPETSYEFVTSDFAQKYNPSYQHSYTDEQVLEQLNLLVFKI